MFLLSTAQSVNQVKLNQFKVFVKEKVPKKISMEKNGKGKKRKLIKISADVIIVSNGTQKTKRSAMTNANI